MTRYGGVGVTNVTRQAVTDLTDLTGDASDLAAVGAELRALRLEHGLSTRKLARRAACARSSVQRLEHGRLKRPRQSFLAALGMGLSPDNHAALTERLVTAAGDAVAPDTDGTRRMRYRRMVRSLVAGTTPLPSSIAVPLALHQRADACWLRSMAILDRPGALDNAQLLDESLRLHEEGRRLRERAGPPVSLWLGKHRIMAGMHLP